MRGFGFFKREEKPAPSQAEQIQATKEQAAVVRGSTQKIINKLEEIRFAPKKDGTIPMEKLEEYKKSVEAFTYKLNHMPASTFDTSAIDRKLVKMAVELRKAIEEERTETADHILKALAFGISRAREPIPEEDMDYEEEILSSREGRMEEFEVMAALLTKKEKLDRTIEKQKTALTEAEEAYKKEYAKVEKMAKDHPELVEELEGFGITVKTLSGGASQLNTAQECVVNLFHNKEDMARILAENISERETINNTIKEQETLLTQSADHDVKLPMEQIEAIRQKFQDTLLEREQRMGEIRELNKQFSHGLDSIFSSSRMIDHVVEILDEYEGIKTKEMAQEEGRRRRLQQEVEEQSMEHSEPTDLTN